MKYHFIIVSLALAIPSPALTMELCSGPNRAERKLTCIHDGDTGWERGRKWRLLNIDTPEIGRGAKCSREKRAGYAARDRVIELMSGGYQILYSGRKDRSGRDLVGVRISGKGDLGKILLKEHYAQPWPNTKNPWCNN